MAWFSLGIHNVTFWILRDYFRERRPLLYVRVFLVACFAVLLIAALILQGHEQWYWSWNCKAQCLFGDLRGNIGGEPRMWMFLQLWWVIESSVFSIIPHFEGPASLCRQWLYREPKKRLSALTKSIHHSTNDSSANIVGSHFGSRAGWYMALVFFVYRGAACVAGFCLRTVLVLVEFLDHYWTSVCCNLLFEVFWLGYGLWSATDDRRAATQYLSGSENAWGFDQLLQMFLLALPVVAALEAIVGELKATIHTKHACTYPT
jgi:hypothetical protein